MSTKRRELRRVIQGVLDDYGVLCTIAQERALCDALADSTLTLLTAKRKPQKPAAANLYPIAQALSVVCVIDFDANRSKLFAEAKRLSQATPMPTKELILSHYAKDRTWYRDDWRGQKGNAPTLGQVRLTWAKIMECSVETEYQRTQQRMEADPQYQTFKQLREAREREQRSQST